MTAFDFDKIERSLGLVVPAAFRKFIADAEPLDFPFGEEEYYENTNEVIYGNREMREDWKGIWQDHFLALGYGDGCGNFYFIKAASIDDDELCLMSHDPPGIEPVGRASESFDSEIDRYKDDVRNGRRVYSKEQRQRDVVTAVRIAIEENLDRDGRMTFVDQNDRNLADELTKLADQLKSLGHDLQVQVNLLDGQLALFAIKWMDVIYCLVYSRSDGYLVGEAVQDELQSKDFWFDYEFEEFDSAKEKLLFLVSDALMDEDE